MSKERQRLIRIFEATTIGAAFAAFDRAHAAAWRDDAVAEYAPNRDGIAGRKADASWEKERVARRALLDILLPLAGLMTPTELAKATNPLTVTRRWREGRILWAENGIAKMAYVVAEDPREIGDEGFLRPHTPESIWVQYISAEQAAAWPETPVLPQSADPNWEAQTGQPASREPATGAPGR